MLARVVCVVALVALVAAPLVSASFLRGERMESELDSFADSLTESSLDSELDALHQLYTGNADIQKRCAAYAKEEFDNTLTRMALVRSHSKKFPGKSPKELQKIVPAAEAKKALEPFGHSGELNWAGYLVSRIASRNERACVLLELRNKESAGKTTNGKGKKYMFLESDSEVESESDSEADSETEAETEAEDAGTAAAGAGCNTDIECASGKCIQPGASSPVAAGPLRPGAPVPKFGKCA